MTKKSLYTVTEAAEVLGLSVSRVRKLCADGRMGRKVGSTWIITAAEIEANTDRPGPGRPSRKHLEA
jgi:excisionase family DNA binding protein